MKRKKLTAESGQALIETAVTLSMLLIMLLGAAELGRVAWAAIQVTNAAKAAAQYGDQDRKAAGDTTGIKNAASAEALTLTNLNTVVSHDCICSDGSASDCGLTACPNSIDEETLTIDTSATFDPLIHLPGLPATYTLSGQAVQKVLSNN